MLVAFMLSREIFLFRSKGIFSYAKFEKALLKPDVFMLLVAANACMLQSICGEAARLLYCSLPASGPIAPFGLGIYV